jgi:hypothetical protein
MTLLSMLPTLREWLLRPEVIELADESERRVGAESPAVSGRPLSEGSDASLTDPALVLGLDLALRDLEELETRKPSSRRLPVMFW